MTAKSGLVSLSLLPFADDHLSSAFTVHAAAQRLADGTLDLMFTLEGPLEKLEIPAELGKQSGFHPELWKNTCFEAFVCHEGQAAYSEWNMAPTGEWAFFEFSRYRERVSADAPRGPTRCEWKQTGKRQLSLKAQLPCSLTGPLQLALTVVLKHASGETTYWALHHAGEKPDFHLRDSFRMRLP